jgi:serine/threonine protein kinase
MIMEYAGGGELFQWVEEHGKICEKDSRIIINQIINAMSYCHNRGIVHRDLKLENVLFKSKDDKLVKVVDFGIAGVCVTGKSDKVDAGSIAYMPPECLSSSNTVTSPGIDVWSIGCMFYAMLFGTLPFWGTIIFLTI